MSPSRNPDTTSDATSPLPIRMYTRRPPHAPPPVPLFPSLPSPRRSARPITGCLPSSLHDYFLGQAEAMSKPTDFATAYSHPGWRMAMQTEFLSIQRNNTWTLVDLPPSRRAITTKWIFKAKPNPNGTTAKLKARLVARGFQQCAGIDFTETFAPIAKIDTFRTLAVVCGHHGWPIYHLDVKSAFLNGEILEEVYVHQLQGFTEPGRESQVCLLKKALYGLRQAPRAWHTKFDACLQDLGLVKSHFDPNLYIFHDGSLIAMLLLYVDDVYLAGSHSDKIAWLRQELFSSFDMTDLGLLSYSLGVEFIQRSTGLILTQRRYLQQILSKFGMANCNPARVLFQPGVKLHRDMHAPTANLATYQRLVGKLLFCNWTRPDITYAVALLCRFTAAPQEPHLLAAKHLLRYLKGTLSLGLHYCRGEDTHLTGFCDADWVGDCEDRKSTGGFLFKLGSSPIT